MAAHRFYIISGEKIFKLFEGIPLSIWSFLWWGFLVQDPSLATKVMSYDAKSSFSDKGGGGCEEKNNPYSFTAEELELQ